jgi:hypothetical protein
MIKQYMFILQFQEGAAGVIHTDEALALHFFKQQYPQLPQLKCTHEIEITPSATPIPTVAFVRGVSTIVRQGPTKTIKPLNKNEPDEVVYVEERRQSAHGPAEGVKETNDFSYYR